MSEILPIIWQLSMGVSLAACAGLRAFLPLFVTGLAARLDWIPLLDRFEWLGSDATLVVFGVAVLLEVVGDKFPVIDNFLDSVALFVKPIAGTILAVAVVTELDPLLSVVLGIVLGGGVAGVVHVGKSKARLASTVFTAGLGNPVLSVAEDGVALAGVSVALWFPVLAIVLITLIGLVITRWTLRRGSSGPDHDAG
ncbi:MAG: DUF4126 domain-containing protein [Acidobacteriota bacterium]|nr:DUF4126 domain-containing protein [Acidobacteriota bacterium]MDH3784525.1 DUF4126 domain-containing protein [Acidobacteriota bacterium]